MTTILAYKALDKNFQCRGYQYAVGQTYTHTGKVEACRSGFHACENPLDVLDYYPLDLDTRFAIVKASGQIERDGNKVASATIAIEAELKFPEFVVSAVKWVQAACNFEKKPDNTASGYSSQLAASGNYSQLAASGDYSQLAASGYSSQLAASGYSSKLAASGKNSIVAAVAPGCRAKAGEGGCIALRWTENERPRLSVAYVGENGIKADVWYELDNVGNFVEVVE
jgi:hypothetical protein